MHTRHFLFATAAAGILAAAPLLSASGQPIEIGTGVELQGRFTSSDSMLPDGSHYRTYRYRGEPGQPIAITMRSSDFDAFLAGGTLQGDEFEAEDYDDDSAGGTDARIQIVVGPGGVYYIRANTLMGGETGSYTLRVDAGAANGSSTGVAPPVEFYDIALGQTVHGQFTAADPTLGDGTYYRLYRYHGEPGQQIVITLRSSDFDAFLGGGGIEDGQPRMSEMDDDGAGGTDARIRATIGPGGVYYITANTVLPGETGAYTLIVEPATATGRN